MRVAVALLGLVLVACGTSSSSNSAAEDILSNDSSFLRDPPRPIRTSGSGNVVKSDRRMAAEAVMANAREVCSIDEEGPHLVVECRSDIAQHRQLGFATAIADADAVLSGTARNIYFYLPGGQQFAQADRLNGVRLKQ